MEATLYYIGQALGIVAVILGFISYQMKLLKPSPAIFEEMIRRSGMRPEETLFIDDGARNANTAHELGFKVYCPTTNSLFGHIFEL